jgi:hypothetical protein
VPFALHAFAFNPDELREDEHLEGVMICELGNRDNCVMTDSDGLALLELPACQEVGFTLEKEGYRSRIYVNVTDDTLVNQGGVPMQTHEQTAAIADQLQTPYPWEGGAVALLFNLSAGGLTFAPVGSSVGEVDESSYFNVGTGKYDPDLEATEAFLGHQNFPLGSGGFVGITPGVHEFEFGGGAGDCTGVSWGWPVEGAPNRIRLPILEGHTTYGSMNCNGSP